jgi:hypothetical protein
MSRRLSAALLAAACCLHFGGCGKSKNDNAPPADQVLLGTGVEAVVHEVKDFTDELERAFETAESPQAGVAEAQRLLDARRPALAARIAAVKAGPQLQGDAAAKREWLEAEVDNTDRVSRLQVKYLDASMRDPAFKARLDKLVGDYKAMFNDSAGR